MAGINDKLNYIQCLVGAFETANKFSTTGSGEDTAYFTYFTPGYIVTGKLVQIGGFKAENFASFKDELVHEFAKGNSVNTFSIAHALHKLRKKELLEGDNELYDENKAIILEDVEITNQNGTTYTTSHFVLFVDQIVGIIPSVK